MCTRCVFSATDGTEQCIECSGGMDPSADGSMCETCKYRTFQ